MPVMKIRLQNFYPILLRIYYIIYLNNNSKQQEKKNAETVDLNS